MLAFILIITQTYYYMTRVIYICNTQILLILLLQHYRFNSLALGIHAYLTYVMSVAFWHSLNDQYKK